MGVVQLILPNAVCGDCETTIWARTASLPQIFSGGEPRPLAARLFCFVPKSLRQNIMRKILLALLAVLSTATLTQAAIAADTVYVIRHLQKADGTDPPLSADGVANSQLLAARLATSGIKAIFATPTQRAMQTGEPLAKQLGIAVTSYDPRDPNALIKAIAAVNGAVLIVGHSNTVPDIVTRLGGARVGPLRDQDYGTIFVVRPGSSAVEQIVLTSEMR